MAHLFASVLAFALGASIMWIAFLAGDLWRRSQRPPSEAQLRDLRRALAAWARKYEQAKPSGRYLKRREAELFDACTKVGLMWISPDEWHRTGAASGEKP